MPSLLNTTVTANYLKTSATTKFGTRALKFVKVVVSGGTPPNLNLIDGTTADSNGIPGYTLSNSLYSIAVRTIQQFAEIYAIGRPATSGGLSFTVVIADDTQNTAGSDSNVQDGSYGALEAQLLTALGAWSSGVVTLTAMDLDGITLA